MLMKLDNSAQANILILNILSQSSRTASSFECCERSLRGTQFFSGR